MALIKSVSSLTVTVGTGKSGICQGCFECTVLAQRSRNFWPEVKSDGYGKVANAVLIKDAAKHLREKDKELSSSILAKLVPKLWHKYCTFRDRILKKYEGYEMLFVESLPCCYDVLRLHAELDMQRNVHYRLSVPEKDSVAFQQLFLSCDTKPAFTMSDFKLTTEGKGDKKLVNFEFTKDESFMDIDFIMTNVPVCNFEPEQSKSNDVEVLNEHINELLFGGTADVGGLGDKEEFRAVWESRGYAERILRPEPTIEEKEKSDVILKDLLEVQQNTFELLQTSLNKQGCEVLLTNAVDQRQNVSELLSSFFFAGNWEKHADTKKSQITIPIPAGMIYNDSGKIEQSNVNKARLNLHQQMVAALGSESIDQVNVNIDQRDLNLEVTVSENTPEVPKRIKQLTKNYSKLVQRDIIERVKGKQIPVFKLTPADLDPKGDLIYECDRYQELNKGGISYVKPNHDWVRIGLNLSDLYDNDDDYNWIDKWGIGFHGSSVEGNVGIAEERKVVAKSTEESPQIRNFHSTDKDVNEVSDSKGDVCGDGAYFTKDPKQAADYVHSKEGQMAGRYCVFEVRLRPPKTRIPERQTDYRIINDPQYARPTGICVYVGKSELANFGATNKRLLRHPQLLSTKEAIEPMRYFINVQLRETNLKLRRRLDLLSSPEFDKIPVTGKKTILVLGSSQSGKTTFINGLLNYLLDIQFEDYFRYEIEEEHIRNSRYEGAISQLFNKTTWTIGYSFKAYHTLYTIIDTPGFDHNSNDDSDFDTFLLKVLSARTGSVNLKKIDAICLVDSKPNVEASAVNIYWLDRVMKIFEAVSSDNVFLVKTFGTDSTSQNQGSNRIGTFGSQFKVDNEVLFKLKSELNDESLSKWEHNAGNYKQLISAISELTGCLLLKKSQEVTSIGVNLVNLERCMLEVQHTFEKLLCESANLDRERARVNEMREQINAAPPTEVRYTVATQVVEKVLKPPGQHVTTCLLCMHTCHLVCMIEQDQDKYGCAAMNHQEPPMRRHCMYCYQRCHWKQHSNTDYVVKHETVTDDKVIHDTLAQYSIRESDIRRGEKLVAALQKNVAQLLLQMISQSEEVKRFQREVEHLETDQSHQKRKEFVDMLIHKERFLREEGYEDRLNQLRNVKMGRKYVQQHLMPNELIIE